MHGDARALGSSRGATANCPVARAARDDIGARSGERGGQAEQSVTDRVAAREQPLPWRGVRAAATRTQATFARAARRRTPASTRHAVYRRLARTLRDDPRLPEAWRGTRFFDAAATISGPGALGLRQRRWCAWLARSSVLAPAAWHLDAIGAELLERNLALVERLRCGPLEPRSPHSPLARAANALAFDEAMVIVEQRMVDDYLRANEVDGAARRAIDALLAASANPWLQRLLGIDADFSAAVREAARAWPGRLSFFAFEIRVAIGQALVRRLHGGA